MRYTQDEQGLLNNFAVEPTVYMAESPSSEQQQRYVVQSLAAVLAIGLTVLVAFVVS